MTYPNNVIFERGLLNTFEATLHSTYLCLKILETFGVITVFNSQQEARNIEKGFARKSTYDRMQKGHRGQR
jgi:hypothetical protein